VQLQSLGSSSALPNPVPPGATGIRSVVDKWGGGAVRANGSHYIIHGGGHGDYAGNEIYTLQLSSDSPAWVRRFGPTPNAQITQGTPYYADGNPASMHTYYSLWFDNQADMLRKVQGGQYVEPSGMNREFNSWRWGAANWSPQGTHPDIPFSYVNAEAGTVMHPTTGNIYYWDARARAIWTKSSNTWTYSDQGATYSNIGGVLLLDTRNNCIWAIGGIEATSSQLHRWDLSSHAITTHNVTGSTGLMTQSKIGGDYCAADGLFYLYQAGTVYTFNPSTLAITPKSMAGTGPQSSYTDNNGVWGKFRYVPELSGFVVSPAWSAPTFFFRATA
jgi:hypothetical protein